LKPLRILAVIEALGITGPAKNLLGFQRAAVAAQGRRVELTVATFRRPRDPRSDEFLDALSQLEIPVRIIPERRAFDPSVVRALRSAVDAVAPDILQTHAIKSHFLIRLSGLPARYPWVAFHHGYTLTRWRSRLDNRLDRWSLPAARRLVTVSNAFARELASIGISPDSVTVLHNAIDPDWGDRVRQNQAAAHALRSRLGWDPRDPVGLIVGRLSREKSHASLLHAWHRLRIRRPDLTPRLLIVGDGPERPAIEELVRELDLASVVHLAGHQPRVDDYYGLASVAILASITEGSPNALLEAMAAQVPAVATAVGGVVEIVAHQESALLVPPLEIDALSHAIERLLTDSALAVRLAVRARRIILERHAPRVRFDALMNVYESLAS
jgi:glycosyltransferase involved in cell wall biosynthesis